jgi:hypothetical protein
MCCGRNNNQRSAQHSVPGRAPAPGAAGLHSHAFQSGPLFQYIGSTALTVMGPISGALYRFQRTGSWLHVDPRDRAGLMRIPVLKAIG